MQRRIHAWLLAAAVVAGCGSGGGGGEGGDEPPAPVRGVVYTYPRDRQLDVPRGARLLVSFADADLAAAADVTLTAADGTPAAIDVTTEGGGKTLAIAPHDLAPGTVYALSLGGDRSHASPARGRTGIGPHRRGGGGGGDDRGDGAHRGGAVAAADDGVDGDGPLLTFTTRSDGPRSGPPTLIAVNGSPPDRLGALRPILDTSTLELVFGEPLDPRTVDGDAIALVDTTTGAPVPATLLAESIHAALDPRAPLDPSHAYELRLADALADLGGEHLAAVALPIAPADSLGATGPIAQTFRTRGDGDPDAAIARTDRTNVMTVAHPLIGSVSAAMKPATIATALADPAALGGPIAFTIPRGTQLASDGLAIALAGAIPADLTTGDVEIELVADGGGLLYRNPHQAPATLPDNDAAPLLVDLTLDLAIYARDPTGNAVLAQTVLGVQLTGLAYADAGALAIETLGALDFGVLGLASAPTNLVLDLISDPAATAAPDTAAPHFVASAPADGTAELATDGGIELVFDEPLDLDRARAGGIRLRDDATGAEVPALLEQRGSVVVVRPRAPLADGRGYRVDVAGVTDLAGNALGEPVSLVVATQPVAATAMPPTVLAVYPGAPCALTSADETSAGRCAGGSPTDDRYAPFTVAADDRLALAFDQPLRADSVTLGAGCGAGSVRVETIDATGACTGTVPGTLIRRARDLAFVPDQPWRSDTLYRYSVISGADARCDPGDLCGANGQPANFDPLAGTAKSGGANLAIEFTATPPTGATTLIATAAPATDTNGSGTVDAAERAGAANRVALRLAGTTGLLTSARFTGPDCLPETPEVEACMYMTGAIPASLGTARTACALPDGTTAATCIPVAMTPQAMYATTMAMTASALGIAIPTATGMSVMRMRAPGDRPLEGYIVERDGKPWMVAALELYMDAPDMALPLATHDLHSKPLAVSLAGPVTIRADGRLALALANTADVPIEVGISAPLGIAGGVKLVIPAGDMALQLLTPPLRGRLP